MADSTESADRTAHRSPGAGPRTAAHRPTRAYLERRTLRRGSAGPLLLTGLGVAYVVSGDFSGWNIGLAEGGFGGLAIAAVLMGLMYTCWSSRWRSWPRSCRPPAAATASPGAPSAPGAAS